MRMEFVTQADAKTGADKIHADLMARDPLYAASVLSGQTLRWATPYQDTDDKGIPLNTKWYVNCKDRSLPTLTTQERASLKPYAAPFVKV